MANSNSNNLTLDKKNHLTLQHFIYSFVSFRNKKYLLKGRQNNWSKN